jgi:hypothetical protein
MITDEMISKCMADFDFEKVADLYQHLKWRWSGKGIPSKSDLIDSAYGKLKDLQDRYPSVSSIESGGLKVTAYDEQYSEDKKSTVIRLQFIAHCAISCEE